MVTVKNVPRNAKMSYSAYCMQGTFRLPTPHCRPGPQWGTAEWEINGPSCIGNHRSFLWGSTFLNALCLSVSLSYFCLLAHSPDYFHEFLLLIFVFLHLHAGYCVFFFGRLFFGTQEVVFSKFGYISLFLCIFLCKVRTIFDVIFYCIFLILGW